MRWYLRFGLSYRDVEELLAERGIEVDHVTVFRWVVRFTPLFVEAGPAGSARPWGQLVRRRDVCEGPRPVALEPVDKPLSWGNGLSVGAQPAQHERDGGRVNERLG